MYMYIYIRYVFMIITGPGVEVNKTNISNLPVYGMRVPESQWKN